MHSQIQSAHWYRVAQLRPALGSHAQTRRHVYRGKTWYVLQDGSSGRVHRFTPSAYHFLGLMDGQRTVDEVLDLTEAALGDDAPTQEEAVALLAQLHAADLLIADTPPDTQEIFRRYQSRERGKWKRRLWSPLALRFPLVDPDRFLERTIARVRPLFGLWASLLWLGVVAAALVLAAIHWPELTENVSDRVLKPANLVLILLIYPIIKALHELGHAYATKRWGGEVHEMGIMLLVLMPIPYVDASAASAFTQKRQRMIVGAAGIMVEMFLAALALFVWLAVEPGVVRALAFNIMLIGGVSTVFFNGNPLLRFDGYYVLSDALEMPNLGARSHRYFGYLIQRHLFGLDDANSPATTPGERFWLLVYALTSFLYRLFILFAIILFIAGKFFIVGVILAAWAGFSQLVVPAARQIGFLLNAPQLQRQRARALSIAAALLAGAVLLLFWAPIPLWTQVEGVVWAPQESEVRAGADATIVRLVAAPDSTVRPGDALLETEDPSLVGRVAILVADLHEATAQYDSLRTSKQVEAQILKEKIVTIEADLALARERVDALTIRSPATGVFLVDRPQELEGRFLRQGDLVGYVADLSRGRVRVVVPQPDIGLIRQKTRWVSVRLAESLGEAIMAKIARQTPSATDLLPSAVLGTQGGGPFAVDPLDERGVRVLEEVFDLELDLQRPVSRLGGRAYVRFHHGSEPLAQQWYRRVRQLFLRRFDV